jgi:HSP20 family protein
MPRVDVLDRDDALLVRTEIPGVDPESIDVTVESGTLTIKGSRSFENEEETENYHRKEIFEGSFERTILLPKGTDAEAVTAVSKDGILEISIPKRPEVLPRKITVEIQR